jgi:hypothetical protein
MTEKVKMPDGKGGYDERDAERFDGSTANAEKQQAALNAKKLDAHETRVGLAAESFNAYHKAYATDYALTEEEIVKGVYLELLNLKEFYPADLGGPQRVDELCQEVFVWFEENKHKA